MLYTVFVLISFVLTVSPFNLSTVGKQAFPVSIASFWNCLPPHVTSATYPCSYPDCRHLTCSLLHPTVDLAIIFVIQASFKLPMMMMMMMYFTYCFMLFQICCYDVLDIEVACYGYEGVDAVKEALKCGLNMSTEDMPIKVDCFMH